MKTSTVPPIAVRIDGPDLLLSCWPARPLLKTLPGARWDRDRKGWVMPAGDLATVRRLLADWPGGVVVVTHDTAPPTATSRSGDGWAAAMFAAVPPHLHKRLHRALSGVLHPDAGGDHAAMAAVSAARDRQGTS